MSGIWWVCSQKLSAALQKKQLTSIEVKPLWSILEAGIIEDLMHIQHPTQMTISPTQPDVAGGYMSLLFLHLLPLYREVKLWVTSPRPWYTRNRVHHPRAAWRSILRTVEAAPLVWINCTGRNGQEMAFQSRAHLLVCLKIDLALRQWSPLKQVLRKSAKVLQLRKKTKSIPQKQERWKSSCQELPKKCLHPHISLRNRNRACETGEWKKL